MKTSKDLNRSGSSEPVQITKTQGCTSGTAPVRQRVLRKSDPNSLPPTFSFLILGLVHKDEVEPVPFCAITWSGSACSPSWVRMYVAGNWQKLLNSKESTYIAALLSDWEQLIESAPANLLALTCELAVGPIRAMRQASMEWEPRGEFIPWLLGVSCPSPYVC